MYINIIVFILCFLLLLLLRRLVCLFLFLYCSMHSFDDWLRNIKQQSNEISTRSVGLCCYCCCCCVLTLYTHNFGSEWWFLRPNNTNILSQQYIDKSNRRNDDDLICSKWCVINVVLQMLRKFHAFEALSMQLIYSIWFGKQTKMNELIKNRTHNCGSATLFETRKIHLNVNSLHTNSVYFFFVCLNKTLFVESISRVQNCFQTNFRTQKTLVYSCLQKVQLTALTFVSLLYYPTNNRPDDIFICLFFLFFVNLFLLFSFTMRL